MSSISDVTVEQYISLEEDMLRLRRFLDTVLDHARDLEKENITLKRKLGELQEVFDREVSDGR